MNLDVGLVHLYRVSNTRVIKNANGYNSNAAGQNTKSICIIKVVPTSLAGLGTSFAPSS